MKGLLLKEWYMMLRHAKGYLLVCLVFFTISIFSEGDTFFEAYPLVLAGMIPITLISYDERSGWISFGNILPCSRKQFVSAKYILAIIIAVFMTACTLIVHIIRIYSAGGGVQLGAGVIAGAAFSLMPPSFVLPAVFKLGSEKGRLAYIVVIAVVCACIPFLNMTSENYTVYADMSAIGFIALPLSLLIFAASWLLSVRFFEKREL